MKNNGIFLHFNEHQKKKEKNKKNGSYFKRLATLVRYYTFRNTTLEHFSNFSVKPVLVVGQYLSSQ